ncbi:MAG: hypothetical protein RLZZ124_512 [Cyanobacteriota bacterium]
MTCAVGGGGRIEAGKPRQGTDLVGPLERATFSLAAPRPGIGISGDGQCAVTITDRVGSTVQLIGPGGGASEHSSRYRGWQSYQAALGKSSIG